MYNPYSQAISGTYATYSGTYATTMGYELARMRNDVYAQGLARVLERTVAYEVAQPNAQELRQRAQIEAFKAQEAEWHIVRARLEAQVEALKPKARLKPSYPTPWVSPMGFDRKPRWRFTWPWQRV